MSLQASPVEDSFTKSALFLVIETRNYLCPLSGHSWLWTGLRILGQIFLPYCTRSFCSYTLYMSYLLPEMGNNQCIWPYVLWFIVEKMSLTRVGWRPFFFFTLCNHLTPCLLTVPKRVCVHQNAEFLVSSYFNSLLKMFRRPVSILYQKHYEDVYLVQSIFSKFSNSFQEFINFTKPKSFLKRLLCMKETEELFVCQYQREIWV